MKPSIIKEKQEKEQDEFIENESYFYNQRLLFSFMMPVVEGMHATGRNHSYSISVKSGME